MTIIFVAGLALIVAGIALVSIPAALIAAGAFTAAVAILVTRGRGDEAEAE